MIFILFCTILCIMDETHTYHKYGGSFQRRFISKAYAYPKNSSVSHARDIDALIRKIDELLMR